MIRPALALCLTACLAHAEETQPGGFANPPLSQMEFGVICDVTLGQTSPAPGTIAGVLNQVDQGLDFDLRTALVPAELGLSFGVRATVADQADTAAFSDTYTVVVTHPPMGPNGQEVEIWETTLSSGTALNLFSFEKPYELVEGPWRFQLLRGDQVVLQQDFVVTPRGTVPPVQKACFGAMILSRAQGPLRALAQGPLRALAQGPLRALAQEPLRALAQARS